MFRRRFERAATIGLGASIAFTSFGQSSLFLVENLPEDYEYAQQEVIPSAFGAGEITLEIWLLLDDSYPVGPTGGGAAQRVNWSDADNQPYSFDSWWYEGNFLLDGHNNSDFTQGTFSLQFYGGGRLRWLFGDGEWAGPGGHWSVGAYPANTTASLLDGEWHLVTLVRRWQDPSASLLELWIDGSLVDTETSPVRTDLRIWFDAWAGFPSAQPGWFWGAEKQAAVGKLFQYEDYKGHLDELRFWSRALSPAEIASGLDTQPDPSAPGLVAWYQFDEAAGTLTCDRLNATQCMQIVNAPPTTWASQQPPVIGGIFYDGFESGDTSRWSLSNP